MTDDKKYDSVLVGYTDEPRMYEGELSSWSVRLKDTELKEMIFSKNGKPCCSVFDPNSEAAKEKRAAKAAATEAVTDDMPF